MCDPTGYERPKGRMWATQRGGYERPKGRCAPQWGGHERPKGRMCAIQRGGYGRRKGGGYERPKGRICAARLSSAQLNATRVGNEGWDMSSRSGCASDPRDESLGGKPSRRPKSFSIDLGPAAPH
eukprot:gene17158-biopygen12858